MNLDKDTLKLHFSYLQFECSISFRSNCLIHARKLPDNSQSMNQTKDNRVEVDCDSTTEL